MSKEKFKRIADALIAKLLSFPDDLWEDMYPVIRATVGDLVVVVGIEEKEDEDGAE